METDNVLIPRLAAATVENHFDTDNMLPYLSPTSLFVKEEEAVELRAASNWGGYNKTIDRQELLRQWQEGSANPSQEPTTAPMATNQMTSKDATVVQPTNAPNSLGRFVIPKISKLGLQSNKAK